MAIDCRKCTYFKVTWEKDRPYSCKMFGFKSKNIPSVDVFLSSGRECLKFIPQLPRKKDGK